MPALLPADCDALRAIISGHRKEPRGPEAVTKDAGQREVSALPHTLPTSPESGGVEDSLVYVASLRDMAATAMVSGYPVVVLAGAVGAVQDLGEWTQLDTIRWGDPRVILLSILGLAVVLAVAVCLKYYRFRIERGSGELVVSYGALERLRHTVVEQEVVAVTMVRSPIDLLFGTTRVVISTARLGQGNSSALTFPSMATQTARRVAEDLLGRSAPELFVRRTGWMAIGTMTAVAFTFTATLMLWRYSVWWAIGSAALALVLASATIRYLSGRVSVSGDDWTIVWSDVGLAHRTAAYRRRSVTLLVERRLPGFPWANLTLIGWAHSRFGRRCLVRTGDPYEMLSKELVESVKEWKPTGVEGNDRN